MRVDDEIQCKELSEIIKENFIHKYEIENKCDSYYDFLDESSLISELLLSLHKPAKDIYKFN